MAVVVERRILIEQFADDDVDIVITDYDSV
jgi:hypothetical protein